MITMDYAKTQLQTEELSFIALKNNTVIEERTDKPQMILKHLHEDKHCFSGALVAAHTLGRAAALLLIYGGAKEVFADTISIPAVECLRDNSVKVTYNTLADTLPDTGDILTAELEQKCLDIHSAFQAYELLSQLVSNKG